MVAIPWLARNEVGAAIAMVVWGAATFAVVPPLQMRVMRVAHEAPGLSSSVNIGAFNWAMRWGRSGRGGDLRWFGLQLCAGDGAIIAALGLLLVIMSGRKQPQAVCTAE